MTRIISSARDLLRAYPVLFCDVWGVIHDGVREYAAAGQIHQWSEVPPTFRLYDSLLVFENYPLPTAPAAGHGSADLQPLRAMVGDAQVVALGEATLEAGFIARTQN